MFTSDFLAFAQVAALCAILGGLSFWALLSLVRFMADLVTGSVWWLDREDRRFVRTQNALYRPAERGRSGLGALLLLALFAWGAAACTVPPMPHPEDHAAWLEHVKRTGW